MNDKHINFLYESHVIIVHNWNEVYVTTGQTYLLVKSRPQIKLNLHCWPSRKL